MKAARAALAALFCAAAPLAARSEGPLPAHHTGDGFRNPDGAAAPKPLGEVLRWQLDAWRDHLPPPPREPTPVVQPDLRQLHANADPVRRTGAQPAPVPSATWIGHATVLVQSGGLNILTDPVYSERASPVTFTGPRRAQPPGVAMADLPAIDVVLISHNHYDHLDRWTVVQLNQRGHGQTLFLVPLGLKAWFTDQGIRNVIELDWWDVHQHQGVDFQLVPVQHWSARGLGDRNKTLWGGWAVFAPDLRWYFSGDAGYSRMFTQTREKLAGRMRDGYLFDLALLAIGAYEPRWFMASQHMNPSEALQVHKDLAARRSLGIHWGTFSLTDEALDQPPRDLAIARAQQGVKEEDFFLLPIGGTWWRPPAPAAKQ